MCQNFIVSPYWMRIMLSLSNEVTQLVYCVLRNFQALFSTHPTLSLPRLAQDVIVLMMLLSISSEFYRRGSVSLTHCLTSSGVGLWSVVT